MTTLISVSDQFESMHCWPEAPEEVSFLRNLHRHVFHVNAEIEVKTDDRELEFIIVKRSLKKFYPPFNAGRLSCEQMAKKIHDGLIGLFGFRNIRVCVFEDGENGAIVSTV